VRFQHNTRLILLISADFSDGLDQAATRYRGIFRVPNCSAPTFLPPFAPRPLRRFIATMEAVTSVCVSPTHRSPCLTYSTVQTIPSPTTLCSSDVAFPSATTFVSASDLRPLYRALSLTSDSGLTRSVQASPSNRRLAENTRPKRVRYPTDWSFTSCCSPPRLTATQLQSVTGCSAGQERTCTSLFEYAHRRTIPTFVGMTGMGSFVRTSPTRVFIFCCDRYVMMVRWSDDVALVNWLK
jgi:hypothetical protein